MEIEAKMAKGHTLSQIFVVLDDKIPFLAIMVKYESLGEVMVDVNRAE